MSENNTGKTRRDIFKTGVLMAVGAVATAAILSEPAQAKVSQRTAMYQPKGHAGQSCAKCARFVPGKAPGADGTCLIVDGNVSPNGWCVMFAPKM